MFRIYDGREHFYQWDLDRKLIVEDDISQVHFCNRTDDCSLVCEVYEDGGQRLVNVPNILLQTAWRINVYAYDKNYTKHCATYDVSARTKPADYAYTETEILNFNVLLERIEAIDQNIGQAVQDYLEEHNIEVDLTGYATEEYVDQAIANIDIPDVDLTGYATEKYVNDAIKAIDLTPYAKSSEVVSTVQSMIKNYPTVDQVNTMIESAIGSIPNVNEVEY